VVVFGFLKRKHRGDIRVQKEPQTLPIEEAFYCFFGASSSVLQALRSQSKKVK